MSPLSSGSKLWEDPGTCYAPGEQLVFGMYKTLQQIESITTTQPVAVWAEGLFVGPLLLLPKPPPYRNSGIFAAQQCPFHKPFGQ